MIRTAYEALRDLLRWGRAYRNAPEFELRDTKALQAFTAGGDVNVVTYQVLIENIGSNPAHNCTPKIYFHGIRPYDSAVESVDAEITIDTTGCWSRSDNPPSLSLSGGGREWCDVFRLVEDYRSGADFDPHNDRHIEFPSANGWTSRGNIQFERTAVDTANLSQRMTRRAVRQTYWEEARVRIESNEASQEIDLDFEDMNSKMDNSPMFNIR